MCLPRVLISSEFHLPVSRILQLVCPIFPPLEGDFELQNDVFAYEQRRAAYA